MRKDLCAMGSLWVRESAEDGCVLISKVGTGGKTLVPMIEPEGVSGRVVGESDEWKRLLQESAVF
jgi:hypothetical protein